MGTAKVFSPEDCAELARLAAEAAPALPRLDAAFRRAMRARRCDALQIRALCALTPGAALRLFGSGRSAADFIEEVEYQGRRLAKLNLPPQAVLDAVAEYGPAGAAPALLERLRLVLALALHTAFYQVREAETQAFYGLFRAELESASLDDLLRRSMEILTRAMRAQTGRLMLAGAGKLAARLGRPLYIEAGSRDERLIFDPVLRGRHASYWSIPFREGERVAAVAQFGFGTPYPWLPRELTLLDAAAERCLAAVRRVRLLDDLAAREEQIRQLAGHLIRAEEEERRRVSRELHDEAGQSMLLLRLELEKLEKAAPVPQRPKLGEVRELAEHAIAEVRRAIAALNPAVLERLGLAAALRQLTARVARSCAAQFMLRVPPQLPEVNQDIQTVVYRLAQECYQNAVRHSAASHVNLSLRTADHWLELTIADDGGGFDIAAALRKPDAFGLTGMRERVALMGGTLELDSRPGHGTRVTARLPLEAAAPAREEAHGEDTSTPGRRPHPVPAGRAKPDRRRTRH